MPLCPFCGRPTIGRNRVCDNLDCRKQMQTSWFENNIAIPEGFLTSTEFAKAKGISVQAVAKNCRKGSYVGAFQDAQSGRWYIPADIPDLPKGGVRIGAGRPTVVDRRKNRPLKATDAEWKRIVETAALTKHSVNDFVVRCALGKSIQLREKGKN